MLASGNYHERIDVLTALATLHADVTHLAAARDLLVYWVVALIHLDDKLRQM